MGDRAGLTAVSFRVAVQRFQGSRGQTGSLVVETPRRTSVRNPESPLREETVRETTPESDSILVQKARNGDEEAFIALYRSHSERVARLAWRLLGSREEAEEVTTDVFLAFHKALPIFRGEATVPTFLHGLTLRHVADRRAKQGRRGRLWATFASSVGGWLRGDASPVLRSPEVAVERRETADRIQTVLAALDGPHRDVLVLREIEGLSHAEIAALTGESEGTVRSRLHHARRKFIAAWNKRPGGER